MPSNETDSIPRQELTGDEILQAISDAVSKATGKKIGVASYPLNTLMSFKGEIRAEGERARDVLTRALHSVDPRFSWALLFGPSSNDQRYYLNVTRVVSPAAYLQFPQRTPPAESPRAFTQEKK